MKTGLNRVLGFILAVVMVLGGVAAAESGTDFEYVLLDDGTAMITGYNGSGQELVFPETLDGHTVTGLGSNFGVGTTAIKNIRSITVPDTMTTIEPGALRFAEYLEEIRTGGDHPVFSFTDGVLYNKQKQSLALYLQGNRAEHFDVPEGIREIEDLAFLRAKLVSVRLPGSVERIGRECFYQCAFLAEASLSEGLRSIDADAFTNCDKLRTIVIPASVTDIAESVFTDAHLKEIRVAEGNPVFTISDGALINIRDGVLIAFPHYSEAESCVIPEGVTRIGNLAFYACHHLKQVTFPDGLLEIGHGAFLMCNHLEAIDLPDSVIRLEDSAFMRNSDVKYLRLPAGLTEIVSNFEDMSITGLEIPESVRVIDRSFYSLPNLTEVVIPDSVSTISHDSFAYCKNLAVITIPASVTEIGCRFAGCSDSLVIRTEKGSYAEQYCRDNGMNWEYIPE